jgi:hypothetical protein
VAASFSLTGTLRLDPRWVDDLNTTLVTDATRVNLTLALTNGDGDGEADAYWRDVRTVADGDTDTIDLSALPLSVFGGTGTLDMATVKLIYVRNLSADSSLAYRVAGDTPPRIPPGGVFLFKADSGPDELWMADAQTIEIQNTGNSAADYEILLIGVKAT